MICDDCTSWINGVNLIPFEAHGTLFKWMLIFWCKIVCLSSEDGKDEE